jgi:multimeric flavodoxin WrbA
MKIIAINGSPRANGNTHTLLEKALEGTAATDTEFINLYDLDDFKGCRSCFACKQKDGQFYGKCAWVDGLSPVLEKIKTADAVVIGSPVYLADVSSAIRALIERMIFPIFPYTRDMASLLNRKVAMGLIFTMNVPKYTMLRMGYDKSFTLIQRYLRHFYGSCELITANDTYQFNDYSKYVCTMFDEKHKAKVRADQFPRDCKKALEMGQKLIEQAKKFQVK